MVIKVTIKGDRVFLRNLDRYRGKQDAKILQALNASALVVQNTARQSVLKGPKTGKIYMRGNRRHQASAPGQPPASDTGTLVRNIIVTVDKVKLSARVIAKTLYSIYLEKGTKRMKPRPFMEPALRSNAQKIIKIFQASLKKL